MDKEYLVYDMLRNKYKRKKEFFFEIELKLDDRMDFIKKIAENKFFYIPEDKFKEEVKKMIEYVKQYPLKKRTYFDSEPVIAYGGVIHKDLIDFVEKQIENNTHLYNSEYEGYKNFGFYNDNFDLWYKLIKLTTKKEKSRLYRKRKRAYSDHLFHLERYFVYFKDRYNKIQEDKELFKKKIKYKKSKKNLYVFEVSVSGILFRNGDHDAGESFKFIISHIDEEKAKRSCYQKNGRDERGELYSGMIVEMCDWHNRPNRTYGVNFHKLELNKENIKEAKKIQKEKYKSKCYFHYAEHLKSL